MSNHGIDIMRWGYKHIAKPIVFHMEPDKAHEVMVGFCRTAGHIPPLMGLLHLMTKVEDGTLERDLMGIHFMNPFGLSAGLDKTGDLTRCLDSAGWGFETFGTVTGTPSNGNPRPWYHRLPEYNSLLIHAGLPSEGVDVVPQRAVGWPRPHGMILSGSVGPSNRHYDKGYDGVIHDMMLAFNGMSSIDGVDIIEANISCPNLQYGEPFSDINVVRTLLHEMDSTDNHKPVMVKLPSMRTESELADVLDAIADTECVKGVSVSNLRRDRDGLDIPPDWMGGISGEPARRYSEDGIRFIRQHYGDRFVINGIGGTFTPDDAMRKLDAGADLVSGITVFMYHGPQSLAEWKRGLIERHE